MDAFQFLFIIMRMEFFFMAGSCFDEDAYSNFIYATEYDEVHLLCNTTVRSPFWWKYLRNNRDPPSYIYMGGSDVVPKYRSRFKVDSETCTLTIHNVTVNDSGLYVFVDRDGFGHAHATLLTVGERNDSLSSENTASNPAACRPFRLQPRLLQTLVTGQRGWVTGLTKLTNRLYIVYRKSDTIIVCNSEQQPFTQLRSIHVNGMKRPADMVASVNSNCLYVADQGSHCVWRVRADHKADKWIDGVVAVGLSVTSGGHLVILIATDVQGSGENATWRGRVEVYGVDKLKLTVLKLPHDVVSPSHVIQTSVKTFIVCHGAHWTALNRVVEVNNEGSIVTSHGGPRGNGMGQLDGPCHIALNADERVFVADARNNRVLLFSRKLNIERVLLTWSRADGVYRPTCLHYDTETSQLAVGLYTGHVEIYNL